MVKHKWAKDLNAFAEGYVLQYYDPVTFRWVDAILREINPIACPQEVWRVKPGQRKLL